MMLVVAPAEDQRETKMASDNEDDNMPARMSPSVEDDGENDTDTAGMSSSETDHRIRGAASRRSKATASQRSRSKVKSPSTSNQVESRQAKVSSSKMKPRGSQSRSRSTADHEDRKSKSSSRRYSTSEGSPHGDEEGSLRKKTSSSSRDPKSSTIKSGTSSSRRGRSATSTSIKTGESKGDKDARNRRRPSGSHALDAITGSSHGRESEQMSSTGSLPKHSESSSRKHRSKSRSADHDTEKSQRSVRSEKSARSDRSGRSSRKAHTHTQQESTLDSAQPATIDETASFDSPPEPALSLRSSVKVASALVKFRKVLAMSKQATASAQKYRDDQEKQAHEKGMDDLGCIDSSGAQKENAKSTKDIGSHHRRGRGSEHHRREGSRHSKHGTSSLHRKKSEHGESSTRSKRRSKERPPTNQLSEHGTAVVDADAFLKEALSNVGKKLSRSSSVLKKESEPQKEDPETTTTDGGNKSSTKESDTKDSTTSLRLKSSAKVSTAVLKFQQALALSKSATQAAKTQQDTQNKLLGEVHADKSSPEDFLLRSSHHNNKYASAMSPVSTLDVDPNTAGSDSPKVPSDLDGDSDIDSEIEIEDVCEDDDTVSDVATDSEDENSFGGDEAMNEADNTAASIPISIVSTESDFDMDSDVEDHSDVEIDSDDDLDSDEELGSADGDVDFADDSDTEKEEKKDIKTNSGSDTDGNAAMDSDDDIEGNRRKGQDPIEVLTPQNCIEANGVGLSPKALNAGGKKSVVDSKTEQISNRLVLARSLSFNSSLSASQSQSLLDKSITDWKSSRDLTALSKGPNLAIPGLSPGDSKPSLSTEEDSQVLSYLPKSIGKQEKEELQDGHRDKGMQKQGRSHSSRRIIPIPSQDSETSKPSRRGLSRRSSSRSMRKLKSAGEASVPLDTARKLLNDESLGRRTRGSSRLRKPITRSRSTCSQSRQDEGDSQRERRSKASSSSGDKGRNRDRQRGSERSKRSSSASRNRTLAGISSLSQAGSTKIEAQKEEGRRPSARRRTPSRAKSHDGSLPYRKSSRNSGKEAGKEGGERKSRKTATPLE